MRNVFSLAAGALCLAMVMGCPSSSGRPKDVPTVDKFEGKVLHNGEPWVFSGQGRPVLDLRHNETAEGFGVPIKEDGSFAIGWMPTGKYSAKLIVNEAANADGVFIYQLKEPFEIKDGLTEYTVELGPDFKGVK